VNKKIIFPATDGAVFRLLHQRPAACSHGGHVSYGGPIWSIQL